MKKIISSLLLFSALQAFSQEKTSIELNYPIPSGDNFISNYDGLVDVGIKYRFSDKENFAFGVSLNANYLTYDEPDIGFKTKNYNFQPRIFGELKLKGIPRLHPALGLGYTFMQFSTTGNGNTGEEIISFNESESLSGFNFNVSFSFDFTKKMFAQVQYDAIKVSNTPEGVPDTKYNTTANFIKLGVGYRF
ncbi:outer membrane protein [Flavobacterium sp. 102]|uniref:outer membrane protein n=1 Tax=Flavobacterium sp. 102 TaxID=2135623 RepID=UPI000EB0CBE8|nr:outer membrane beta-barrel protein [Flavobacterium sp. 102]RKS01754.1 opacity protein-like surface antigen [Flavobacterium sp. 102]